MRQSLTVFFRQWALRSGLFFLFFLIGCAGPPAAPPAEVDPPTAHPPTAVASPTPITHHPSPTTQPPPPETELIICQASEPETLFLYGGQTLDQQNIWHGIYENLLTTRGYDDQAQGIEQLPTTANGGLRVEVVTVSGGEMVVDAAGELVPLRQGTTVVDAAGAELAFEGTPIEMTQLVATFMLKPLVWSDGTPVTAADSVYSFEVNRDVALPFGAPPNQPLIARTAAYEALDERTVRWVGVPGYLDQRVIQNVWPPLPRHQLGRLSLAELPTAVEAARFPLSTGPFVVEAWEPGQFIRLVQNPHYVRPGYPVVDAVRFRFIPDAERALADLAAGRCHIVTRSLLDVGNGPALLAGEAKGDWVAHFQPGIVFEHLDFGINSADGYGDGVGRPDWFDDVRVRQAVASCLDRQALIDELLLGVGEPLDGYIPAEHPLFPADLTRWTHDPARGRALLDEAGLLDRDGDGVREAADGTPLAVTYLGTLGATLRPAMIDKIAAQLTDCGLEVQIELLDGARFFAGEPEGPVFGRRFDLAQFAWLTGITPPCHLWQSTTTGDVVNDQNNTGWRSNQFDDACRAAQRHLPDDPAYTAAHQDALRLFNQELPVIPLVQRVFVAAARPEVQNFALDPTQPSELWNLAEIGLTP